MNSTAGKPKRMRDKGKVAESPTVEIEQKAQLKLLQGREATRRKRNKKNMINERRQAPEDTHIKLLITG